MASAEVELDENLHSRQIALYGRQSMHKLRHANVLVVGSDGLAAEVSKNVILANVQAVTLCDLGKRAEARNLSSHFFLTEDDFGKSIATVTQPRFQELNDSVAVSATSEIPESLDGFTTVVCVGVPLDLAQRLNDECRSRRPQIAFVRCSSRGLFGSVFADFGDEFWVRDPDGLPPTEAIITNISEGKNGCYHITTVADKKKKLFLERGKDVMKFSEVKGMTELNGSEYTVSRSTNFGFSIRKEPGDVLSPYKGGGIAVQVKQPEVFHFKSLRQSLKEPGEFVVADGGVRDRPALLHLLDQALDEFQGSHGYLPAPANQEHADEVLASVEALLDKVRMPTGKAPVVDADVVRRLTSGASAVVNPMAAILGGIVGQEVIKASTGQFRPLTQWIHMDALHCLPQEGLDASDVRPMGSRYDDMIAVFGRKFHAKLADLKYFMVGCGALGCEFLKNFALMGMATGEQGLVTVTDDDIIERSNLTRQFLFRNRDVGQSKSAVAAKAVVKMNPKLHIVTHQDRVSRDTEAVFDSKFWSSQDGVCNALDNVKARIYVDEKCVRYCLPLFDSGTRGTQCSVQVIIPRVSENYGASSDGSEPQVAACVLHNFPHTIEHCLPLARSEFVGHFEANPREVSRYLSAESGQSYVDSLVKAGSSTGDILDKVRGHEQWGGGIVDCLGPECRPSRFEDCVSWARRTFEDYFVNRIIQLTALYPEDATTKTGALFWTPPKRFPRPVHFDQDDAMCMQFIVSASNLRAKVFGIPVPDNNRDEGLFKSLLEVVVVPSFIPRDDVTIETEEDAESDQELELNLEEDEDVIKALLDELPTPQQLRESKLTMTMEEFEKDDDSNFHMDFIGSLANMRARNYSIPEVDKLKAKLIAGRIIPAIATATAMATGFVCLELCKLINKKPREAHRNVSANLAQPSITLFQPMEARHNFSRKVETCPEPEKYPDYIVEEDILCVPEGFSAWDSLDVEHEHDLTLQELIDFFEKTLGLELCVLTADDTGMLLYNQVMPKHAERLQVPMSELVRTVGQVNLANRKDVLLVPIFMKKDSDDLKVETPIVKYSLPSPV